MHKCSTCKHTNNCAMEWQLNDVRDMYTITIQVTECKSYTQERDLWHSQDLMKKQQKN